MDNREISKTIQQPNSYFYNSEIVHAVQFGGAKLSNLNENYNPIMRGTCKKKSPFLKPKSKEMEHKKTLVLDLDETLVHASFKPVAGADISKHLLFNLLIK